MTEGKQFKDQLIRLTDLAAASDLIEDCSFENCHLVGPAIIFLDGSSSWSGSTVEAEPDAFIWPIATAREYIVGAIVMRNCTVTDCRLSRIGLAAKEADVAQFRNAFSPA